MKRLLAAALLSLPVLAQAAQWTRVASAAVADSYIDKASIVKVDAGAKVWSLVSYTKEQQTPDGTPYLSMKALHKYACKERTTTLLIQVFYAEQMGKGEAVRSFKYEKFEPEDVIPDSATDDALQIICRKKK
jgi:hypothetical protein